MKNILIIGLARYGKQLAEKFTELGDEVMVIDRNEESVQELMNTVTYAQVGDCMKEEVLRSLGVNNFDICFVCMGEDFQSSLEITDLLKTLGAKYVVSKAGRDIHAKFLLKNGADEVIYPEKDMALKTAVKYSSNHLVDYFEISNDVAVYEIHVPENWVEKTIIGLDVRGKYHMNILAIRDTDGNLDAQPLPTHTFRDGERIIVLSDHANIKRFIK